MRQRTAIVTAFVSMIGILALMNCNVADVVWIAPGSTAQHLTFRIGRWRGDYRPLVVRTLTVSPAEDLDSATRVARTWTFYGPTHPIREVVYGAQAPRLRPGHYEVDVDLDGRSATGWFEVTTNGGALVERRVR